MKYFGILLSMLLLYACQQTMEPWQSDNKGQDVAMYVRTRSLSGITSTPTAYQFFIQDKASRKFTQYHINASQTNQMQLKLVAGDYIGYCVTGGEEDEDWIFEENLTAEEIFLKAQKQPGVIRILFRPFAWEIRA